MIDLINAIGAMDPVQAICATAIVVALIFAVCIGVYKTVEAIAGAVRNRK